MSVTYSTKPLHDDDDDDESDCIYAAIVPTDGSHYSDQSVQIELGSNVCEDKRSLADCTGNTVVVRMARAISG